jgi:hypothetical protein
MIELQIGNRPVGVTVEPDAKHPGMWRAHMGERVSDTTNLARAKDAAIAWARPRGLGGGRAQSAPAVVAGTSTADVGLPDPAAPVARREGGSSRTLPHGLA